MKNFQKINSFFGGDREETRGDLRPNSTWSQFFPGLFHADYSEILSTFSIPVLVILLSILLAHTAKGESGSRLSDYFESTETSGELYPAAPRKVPAPQKLADQSIPTAQTETMAPREQSPVLRSTPTLQSEPTVHTYTLPSGATVREYRGEGGMLIRENHWSDSSYDPVMRADSPNSYRSSSNWREDSSSLNAREQEIREQALRDQAIRDQAVREQAIREQVIREQALRDQEIREQAIREQILREQAIREQEIREQVAREFEERAARERNSAPAPVPASISLNDEPVDGNPIR